MTTQQHPLTPPPELVKQWLGEYFDCTVNGELNDSERFLTTRAAQWGADQELEACCEWLETALVGAKPLTTELRAARRPKPSILAEDALALINHNPVNQPFLSKKGIDTIRRALEKLQQLEEQQ